MKSIHDQISTGVFNQANALTRLSLLLHNILPIECRDHVQVANVRQQMLILITDSPVWTTRLRQLSPQILRYIHQNTTKFNACFGKLKSSQNPVIHHVQISTRFHSNTSSSHTIKNIHKPVISKKTLELLSQSAEDISHLPLKNALLKLARRNNK